MQWYPWPKSNLAPHSNLMGLILTGRILTLLTSQLSYSFEACLFKYFCSLPVRCLLHSKMAHIVTL